MTRNEWRAFIAIAVNTPWLIVFLHFGNTGQHEFGALVLFQMVATSLTFYAAGRLSK